MVRSVAPYVFIFLGAVVAFAGAVLATGAALTYSGHSAGLYLPAGLALIGSGGLIAAGRTSGVWIYVALFAATFLRTLIEADPYLWNWIPAITGPFILLLAVGALLPVMDRRSYNWYQYFSAIGFLLTAFAAGAASLSPTHPIASQGALLYSEGSGRAFPNGAGGASPPASPAWTAPGGDNPCGQLRSECPAAAPELGHRSVLPLHPYGPLRPPLIPVSDGQPLVTPARGEGLNLEPGTF